MSTRPAAEAPLPRFTWLDQLAAAPTEETGALSRSLRIYPPAREVLPPAVLNWGLVTAARVADEVSELRRSEAISVWGGTERLERLACTAGVLTTLVSMRTGAPVEKAPEEMLRQTRAVFHRGGDLASVIRFVWSHHVRFQERLLIAQRELATTADSGTAVQDLHSRMNQILDVYISSIDEEFRLEQQRFDGGVPAQRRLLIEEILAGQQPPAAPGEQLGVSLSGSYFFVFLGSGQGLLEEERRAELRGLRTGLMEQLGAVGGFTQDLGENSLLWCFLLPLSPAVDARERLRRVRLAPDLRIGVGPVVHGAAQLSAAVLGAAGAQEVSAHPARRPVANRADLVFFEEVRLLGILTREDREIGLFLRATLGELARDTQKYADLRRTLLAYLLTGRSRKAAAKQLHISANTVAYRVAQARELAGQRELDASVEVLAALHILVQLPGLGTAGDPEDQSLT